MMIVGLWFGETKPFMPTFTMPLNISLQVLEEDIDVKVGDSDVKCREYIICMTADLPAKAVLTICIVYFKVLQSSFWIYGFSASCAKEELSLHFLDGVVCDRLLSIKHVSSAWRIPWLISGNIKFWKETVSSKHG